MSVDYQTPEYLNSLAIVAKCRATTAGSPAVKKGKTLYMPMIDPSDHSTANEMRYNQMLDLAL